MPVLLYHYPLSLRLAVMELLLIKLYRLYMYIYTIVNPTIFLGVIYFINTSGYIFNISTDNGPFIDELLHEFPT